MAQFNVHEGLVGVRSGHGVASGLQLSLAASDAELAVSAGTFKTRFNDPTKEQRINEGGDLVAVSAPANITAASLAIGTHYVFAHKDGTVKVDDPGAQGSISDGPLMNPARVALKVHPGSACLGSVEAYLASSTLTIAGTPTAGDVVTVVIKGNNHHTTASYTVKTSDTPTIIAAALKTALEADWRAMNVFTVAVAAGVMTLTPVAGAKIPSITATAVGATTTATVASTKKFKNIDYSRRETLA